MLFSAFYLIQIVSLLTLYTICVSIYNCYYWLLAFALNHCLLFSYLSTLLLVEKRKNLKMNLNTFNIPPNNLMKDINVSCNQRQNLPKIVPFNQRLLIEMSR